MVQMQAANLALLTALLFPLKFATALSSYHTNCTIPPTNTTDGFYFVSSPNIRGSLQIVWTCLSTLIICVYKVLHFDVKPKQKYKIPKAIFWSLVAVLAPEYILSEAIGDFREARKRLKQFREADLTQWTLTHMFYANSFGFVLRCGDEDQTLDGKRLLRAIQAGLVDKTPPVTEEEIMDKSKDDSFTKGLAVLQIVYFYVDLSTRIWQGRLAAISQLELSVASVAIYSLCTYILLWKKPKSIATPTFITVHELLKKEPRLADETEATRLVDPPTESGDEPPAAPRDVIVETLKARSFGKIVDRGFEFILMIFTCMPLGAVHLAGWHFTFPSVADKWLWRISAIICTGYGLLSVIGFLAFVILIEVFEDLEDLILLVLIIPAFLWVLLYPAARIVLTVEAIRTLFFLPASAFATTSWSTSIPHFG